MARKLDVLGTHEAAELLGISKNLFAQWCVRGKAPAPDAQLAMGPVWRRSTIEQFAATLQPRPAPITTGTAQGAPQPLHGPLSDVGVPAHS